MRTANWLAGISISCACVGVASSVMAQPTDAGAPARERASLPRVAAESPAGRFGLRGQLAVSSDAGLSISNTSVGGTDGSTTELVVRPAVDYFVLDGLSLGGFLGLDYAA